MGIPHLAVPYRIVDGQAATVDQDSPDDVAQSIQILVTTPVGSRLQVPGYGITQPLFKESNSPVTSDILAAAKRWEPRAEIDVTDAIDSVDDLIRDIAIRVRTVGVNQ